MNRIRKVIAAPAILAIKGYQRYISRYTPPRCKYYPTCSNYALISFERHGLIKGILLVGWRIVRCNPFSNGGIDYPPLVREWKAAPYHQMSEQELKVHWAELDRKKYS